MNYIKSSIKAESSRKVSLNLNVTPGLSGLSMRALIGAFLLLAVAFFLGISVMPEALVYISNFLHEIGGRRSAGGIVASVDVTYNPGMMVFLLVFLATSIGSLLIVRLNRRSSGGKEVEFSFHSRRVPRIGGVPIALGVLLGLYVSIEWNFQNLARYRVDFSLAMASAVVLGVGVSEDLTQRVSVFSRVLIACFASLLVILVADVRVEGVDIPWFGYLLSFLGVSMAFTVFATVGVVNSINIIDGFNGLAVMCSAIIFAALGYVGYQVGNIMVLNYSLILLGATLGFFVWNYPYGLIFLGDGGAYFLGFWIAELSILLIQSSPGVSPIFPLLLCAYPIFETVFSMYRRRFVMGRSVLAPDASHLHSLIYRRIARYDFGNNDAAAQLRRNSMTSPYLWVICAMSAIPAVLSWDDSLALSFWLVTYCVAYVLSRPCKTHKLLF